MARKLRTIIGMLVAIFILGMAVNLVGVPDKDASVVHNIFSGIFIALHVLTAIGILVTATQLMRLSADLQKSEVKRLARGFGAVGIAFFAGITTMVVPSPWSEIASFIMAVGFIAALILYGTALLRTNITRQV